MNTILIVDDDPKLRDMLSKFLELNNYTVVTAHDGLSGLETASRIMPDVIISDIIMPGMDGYKLKDSLSKHPEFATIPFIFLTSMREYKNIRKGMELGADDYLAKPFNLNDVLRSITRQLEKRRTLLKKFEKKFRKNLKKEYDQSEHILIRDKGNPRFIKISNIICISAEEKYSRIVLFGNEKLIVSISLKQWEEMLPVNVFLRIHRSTIINITCIEKVEKWLKRRYRVRLKGIDEPFEISRRYYSKMTEFFAG